MYSGNYHVTRYAPREYTIFYAFIQIYMSCIYAPKVYHSDALKAYIRMMLCSVNYHVQCMQLKNAFMLSTQVKKCSLEIFYHVYG